MTCEFHASEEGGKKYQETCGDCIESGPAPDAPTQEEIDSAMKSEKNTEGEEEEKPEEDETEDATRGSPIRGPRMGVKRRGRR